MQKKSLDIYSSIEWLSAGKILAHPTEGIWGLGCDALNKSSFSKIYDLKKRPQNKSFILLIPSILSIKKYLIALSKEDLNFLNKIWPGHTTVLVKYNKNLPSHLCNDNGKIAIRVSNHLPIKQLLNGFNGFMISTSANISGQKNLQNPNQIIDTFDDIDLAYYDALSGEKTKPSSIIDLESRKVIRE